MDTMNDRENYEQLLKAMGFSDENEIRQALAISNNDINEAVAILTNEKLPKMTSLIHSTDNDIEMCDISNDNNSQYNHTNHNNNSNSGTESFHSPNYLNSPENNPLEFPVDCLYHLENNVFTDSWSIPYKKDEWLGRLLISAIALSKEGQAETDENCKRFLDRLIPEVYKKLLNSSPVARWNQEIQNGVNNMTSLCVELIAIRVNQNGVPEILLNTLSLIFDRENEFNTKNISKPWERQLIEKLGGINNLYTSNNDTYGWLINLINLFGINKGFDGIKMQLENSKTINEFNCLLKPISICCNYLNRDLFISLFEQSFFRIYEVIKKIEGDDFKDKNIGKVFELFVTMKKLSNYLWPNELENLNRLHLDVVLNMLKYPHYNAKMNSLKEICKLVELSNTQKTTIKEDNLIEWIISERILSLSVEGNIDQSQYCDKIKTIVEFIGDRIKNEEIGELWNMQYNKPMSIVENLYNIIAIAATKFNSEQLDFLLTQINQTWINPLFKLHDKLVTLLRMIGREAKSLKVYTKVLEALWELKNRENVSRQLLLLIYNEHLSVLTGCRLSRENVKREYLKKCCDEIKSAPGTTIAIASLKHIYDILNSYQKVAIKSLKDVLSDILMPLLRTICSSLTKYHKNSCEKALKLNKTLEPSLFIDDVFTHEEAITYHLHLLKFVLQEGSLYLNFSYAQEIWDVLITNSKSCEWDKYVGFTLFIDCILDLNEDSRIDIFKKQILKLKPSQLTLKGYECFKLYFLKVNEHEGKIYSRNDDFTVDKHDLSGRNFLWDIILYANDDEIADLATKFLLEILYEKVSLKLKRDLSQLHSRFIQECYEKLENCLVTLDNNPIGQLLWNVFKISYLSVNLTEFNSIEVSPRSEKLKCIERLLLIAEKYIITVEENSLPTRTNLPHFITFKGEIFQLMILFDNQKQPIELFVSSNESLGELRGRLATLLSTSSNCIQIYYNEKLLNLSNDLKLLCNLNIDGMMPLNVRTVSTYPLTPIKDSGPNFLATRTDFELEKCLPGVLMASGANGGNAFELLYRLEDLDEPKIQNRVRNILKIIPTDPKLLESFDRITNKLQNQTTSNNSNNNSILETSFDSSMNSNKELTPKRNESFSTLDSRMSYSTSKDFSYFFNKDVPLHRILYHLEALCSRIAPLASDSGTIQSSELFQQDFLKTNGIEILISLLKLDTQLNENDYEIRQNIYILNLQLMRLILFGSLFPINPSVQSSNYQNAINKRPSTEPISTCAKKTITPAMINTNPINNLNVLNQQNFSENPINNIYTEKLLQGNIVNILSITQMYDIISQLLILVWSSAAGNIELANKLKNQTLNIKSSNSPNKEINETEINVSNMIKINKEVKFVVSDHRLSTSSNMSTSSIDSSSEHHHQHQQQQNTLHSGICMKKTFISSKDIKIAAKAVEIISCFVQHRKDCINHLFNLQIFNECIVDILTGSPSSEIRSYMEKFLLKLSTIETPTIKCKEILLSIIIKARLPLWVNSSLVRGSAQRLISQSSQYFNLRCSLLENLTHSEQTGYSIDIDKMINDEISWLNCFTPTKNLKDIDNILLSGHLYLLKSLLTAEGINKNNVGEQIIPKLLQNYLFPSSFILNQLSLSSSSSTSTSSLSLYSFESSEELVMEPICSLESSRIATYNLLVELSRNCLSNFSTIIKQLIQFHHKSNEVLSNELWNYIPPVIPRSECGYVGLKNGGATCYMNAVLQQLFMMPGISEYLLSIEDESDKDKSVFYQLQNVFAHLKESKLEYYTPDGFWKAFRIAGLEVNIREQQDAFDFFISLTDQIDEYLKKKSKKPIFKNIFEGTFSNQLICKDCPHRYEREEAFYGLNLIIKAGNLQDSLAQFVKDELLDGDNAYNCEKCGEKRSAIKRTCIKKLPKYLCIQLKRFDYDWELNRSLKFDDYFEFPRRFDIQPYMVENISKTRDLPSIEENVQLNTDNYEINFSSSKPVSIKSKSLLQNQQQHQQPILYDLVGIIVHSGQANAGHYYSFIKAPQNDDIVDLSDSKYNNFNEKWFKFNDTNVEDINFNDNTLMEECFGGTFTCNSDNRCLPEERIRYWNAYMLIYKVENDINAFERNDYSKPIKPIKSVARRDCYHASKFTHDSLSELAELVSRGDEKGLFNACLPPAIEQTVKFENLEFCKNKDIYNNDYFQFIYNMTRLFKLIQPNDSHYNEFAIECTNLGFKFLFNTLFKTGKKLRNDLNKWIDLFTELFSSSKDASLTALNLILEHEANSNFIKHFMIESPVIDIREICIGLFESCLYSLFKFDLKPTHNKINSLVASIVSLLDKAVIDLCKNSHEYFTFLYKYANISKECVDHLVSLNLFSKLMCFLLGSPANMKTEEITNRRWNSIQSKEFSILHELISIIILRCNLSAFKTCDVTNVIEYSNNDLIAMPQEIQIYLYGALSNRYFKEIIHAFDEINHTNLTKTIEMITTCCYCNETFSANLIYQILIHLNNSSSNELKNTLNLLQNICLIEDPLQIKRLKLITDGYKSNDIVQNGLLNIIRQNQLSDTIKSYQCVKFIVSLANKSSPCKDYLLKTANNWEWAVNWLKSKMSDSINSSSFVSWNTKPQSNDDSETKTFQRTKSAQRTLDDATALLSRSNELDEL